MPPARADRGNLSPRRPCWCGTEGLKIVGERGGCELNLARRESESERERRGYRQAESVRVVEWSGVGVVSGQW